jgi:hypothetical protein
LHRGLLLLSAFCWSTPAYAESALFGGLRLGGAVASGAGHPAEISLRVGAGLDWVFASGPMLTLRGDTTHEVDASFVLGIGWAFRGMIDGDGPPLSLSAGFLAAIDREADTRAGVRLNAAWGLWSNRATIDLDVDVRRATAPSGRPARDGWETIIALSLRVVPWAPWRL